MLSSEPVPRPGFRSLVHTAGGSLADAVRITPRWLTVCSALVVALSLLPGLQVLMVERLVEGLSGRGAGLGSEWMPVLGLAVVVGLVLPLGQVMLAATQRLTLRMELGYRSELIAAVARLAPSRLRSAEVATAMAASQAATTNMGLGGVAAKTVQLLGACLTAAVLCAAVVSVNAVSGLLVAAALLPPVAAFTFVARTEADGWPRFASFERRADYATQQLMQQRPGTELAVLGSGHKVASLAVSERRKAMRIMDGMIGTAMVMELASALVTVLLFGGALAVMVADGATGAAAAAAVAGMISGLSAIRSCGYAVGTIISAVPQAQVYRRFLASVPDHGPQGIVRGSRRVRLDQATVRYPGAAEPALKDVSIEAGHGEMIALVGVNGAGKTTAINALLGTLALESGRVLINGTDAAAMTEVERLGYFGLLVQEFGRYEFTVRDVVALGSPDGAVSDDQVWQALDGAKADGFVRAMPAALDTQLGEQWGGTGISGGQWQRLGLARISLRDAGIWILDEPTSAIDAEAEERIFTELLRTKHTRITIVVSHRAWTLKDMDRIYVIDDGRVVQQGTYPDLLAQRNGRFAQIFAGQMSKP